MDEAGSDPATLRPMSDSPDELILKMQHLEAQARASSEARAQLSGVERFKSAAQKVAATARKEVAAAEQQQAEAEQKIAELKVDGVAGSEAAEYLAARAKMEDAGKRLVRARAQLNYALDQLTEVERREFEASAAETRAELHGEFSEDPLFNKGV